MTKHTNRSLKDRVLDRIPLFGTVRRTKGWVRRNKGIVYLVLFVIVLFVVRPLLSILAVLFSFMKPVVDAILGTVVGRVIFYNVLGFLLLWIIWRQMRASIYRAYGMRAMRHFLDGMNQMLRSRWDNAIPHFENVLKKTPRWVNLEDAVPEHREILADAQIKIATCHLRQGRATEAKQMLLPLREKEFLSEHVRRNHAELRALAYDLSDGLEPETIIKELEKSESRDKSNKRVLRALRDRLENAGDLEGARRVGRKLAAVTSGPASEEAERDLALLEFRLAHQALSEGDQGRMRKALKATSTSTRSALKLGELALENGDIKGALKAWSRAPSLPVFERLERLLRDGKLAGDKEKDLLLKHFPYAGTMRVLAKHYLEREEFRKARVALDKALETTGEDMELLRLYAQCLEGEGDNEGAARLYQRALSRSLN